MRKIISLNSGWLYSAKFTNLDKPDEQFESISLPHSNKLFLHSNNDNLDYQFVSHYRKHFSYQEEMLNEHVFLDFDGVMLACKVFLNNDLLCENLGGYRPFSVNLSPALCKGDNTIDVIVDSNERTDVPPYGHLVDYLTYGGIYRDVQLRVVNSVHIKNVFVKTINVLNDPQVFCDVSLNQAISGLSLEAVLLDHNKLPIATVKSLVVDDSCTLVFDHLPGISLWDLDNPTLYFVSISLFEGENLIDNVVERFGFRTAEFCSDGGFYLNGKRIKLFGLNRHQTFPYIGAAAPKRLQEQDAEILKYELACNIVRTSHYPQSPHFLNRCDEIGLLVFEEITGWQHIGDAHWQEISLNELEAFILRDRNHPSIIMWGARVDESIDDDGFYSKTNNLAHHLDPTRQTGGVRNFLGSNQLEDVYTFNDFSGSIKEPPQKPHLITEFAGHMYPTKVWDHEERLIDHALLHARIHNEQLGLQDIAGAIGWCAFDYATHIEFGSGDRVCYHGIMDIFRLPKWAAYFYQSQQSPNREIVLKAATHWTMGDRNGGGTSPLTIFSNCDEIEVLFGETNLGRFKPDREGFPNLLHPPFIIGGLEKYNAWGQREFHDLHFIGYINNKAVAQQTIPSDRLPKALDLQLYSDTLVADGADMTRLAFRVVDAFGNPLPYVPIIVDFTIEGPAELIGENPYPLFGGQAALFVKAKQESGTVTIHAMAGELPAVSISLEIIKND